jgi:hypothetical protein
MAGSLFVTALLVSIGTLQQIAFVARHRSKKLLANLHAYFYYFLFLPFIFCDALVLMSIFLLPLPTLS